MRFYILLLLTLSLTACEPPKKEPLGKFKSEYYRIPAEDLVGLAKAGKLNYTYAKFMNLDGTLLTAEEQQQLNRGLMAKDYFSDAEGRIVEVRVREIEPADKLIEIQRREIVQKPFKHFKKLNVNCNQVDSLYAAMERTDQEVRFSKAGDLKKVDRHNQEVLFALVNKCGWSDKHVNSVWTIIQHAPIGLMAYYYADLKKAVLDRKLDPSKIALIEDRMLMKHNYKQLYGTQIMDGQLYDLEYPDKINMMRQQVGLHPIEKYLKHFDLDWEVEKKRMTAIEK